MKRRYGVEATPVVMVKMVPGLRYSQRVLRAHQTGTWATIEIETAEVEKTVLRSI